MIKSKNKKAFTLVELIIVITILAILATIAFISFQGYSKNARDGNRLTALRNIKSGLEIYYNQVGNYPDTESGTLIQSSGGLTIIGTQGYFGDTDSRLLKFSKTPTDPYDGSKYIYSVNAQKNKYQIMGFLETSDYVSLVKDTYAADYSTRTPKTLGDNLGILLDSNNNPISGTGIDVENYTGSLKAVFSDNYNVSGTGTNLKVVKSTFKDGKMWNMIDKNCDLPDVVIGNQVWAGCNSTLGYGAEWGQLNSDIGTNNYNGTISNCYKYSATSLSTTTDCPAGTGTMMSNAKESNWGGASGVSGVVNNIWGKFYKWNNLSTNCKGGDFTSSTSNSNCPCPIGRHVPTSTEWGILTTVLNGGTTCDNNTIGWKCSGLGWLNNSSKTVNNNIIQALKIPIAGLSVNNGSGFFHRGNYADLWFSTTSGATSYDNAITRYFNWASDSFKVDETPKTHGLSVRCIKD